MRTILPTLLVVALAAAFLVSHLNKTAPVVAEPESIADQLHSIVRQSLKGATTQNTKQKWQDLRAEGSAVDIMTFLSENPTSPHKEEAVAHLQTLLGGENVTRTAPDLLTLAPATSGF